MTATINVKKNRPNYYVVIRFYDETKGKERQKWVATDIPVKGNNKRKAERRKNEVLAQYKNEEHNLCHRIKMDSSKNAYFVDFIKEWLETSKKSRKISESTYDGYLLISKVHIVPYFEPMKLKVKDMESMHIQKYVNYKLETLSPNTVKKHVSNISKCLDSAVRQNVLNFNPVQRIEEVKKVKYTGAKFLNEKEIEQLLFCSKGDPLEIVILLTLFYGLRRSEVLGLKWSAIDFENHVISINHTVVRTNKTIHCKDSTKNDSSNAMLPLPDILKCHLKKWRAKQLQNKLLQPNDYIDSDYVCTMFDGSLMQPNYVSRHFKLILTKNNLKPIRFHDCRHSSASYLKHLGFDLKDIQVWLRYADIQTSMNLYTHLDMDAKKNIADKLDARITGFGF